MSTTFPRAVRERAGFGSLSPHLGAGALAGTQAADLLLTLAALRFVPGVREANVVLAGVVDAFGPAIGLTAAAVLSVGALVLVTERAASFVGSHPDGSPGLVAATRLVGYGPMTGLNVVVVCHNALLLASVLRTG